MARPGSPFVVQIAAAIPGLLGTGARVVENRLRIVKTDETTAVFPGDIVGGHRDD